MDLFSIICTTCHQRLVVRRLSAIGQILTCPNCSSMVEVRAPEGWHPPVGEEADAVPGPSSSNPTPGQLQVGPSKPSAYDGSPKLSTYDGPAKPSTYDGPAAEPAPATLPTSPTVDSVPAIDPVPPSDPVPLSDPVQPVDRDSSSAPHPAWQSAAERQWRPIALTGVVAVAVIAVAAVTITTILGRSDDSDRPSHVQAPTSDPDPKDVTQHDPASSPVSDRSDPRTEPDVERDNEVSTLPVEETRTEPDDVVAVNETTEPLPADESPRPGTNDEPNANEQPRAAEQPNAPLPVGPPDLVARPPATAEPPAGDDPRTDRFEGLLQDEQFAEPDEALPEPPPGDIVEQSIPRPAPREVDVPARLADAIQEVKLENVAIVDFAEFVSQFSTLPVTVDVEGLAWAKRSLTSGLSAEATQTTMGQLLAAALEPQGLECLPLDDQLLITRRSNYHDAVRVVSHRIDDLVKNDAESKQLQEWITSLVAAGTWQPAGEPGRIRLADQAIVAEHLETVQFQILRLLEGLRVARGGLPRSDYPQEMFGQPSRSTRAQAVLDSQLTLNYSRPTRLTAILHRIGQETGAQIVVDWRSTMQLGWTNDSEATLIADKQPLHEVLQQMLHPMDLGYRVIDARTIQIVAAADLATTCELEIYSVAKQLDSGHSPQELIDALSGEILRQRPPQQRGPLAIHYDAQSKCLLVSLPQPEQRLIEQALR